MGGTLVEFQIEDPSRDPLAEVAGQCHDLGVHFVAAAEKASEVLEVVVEHGATVRLAFMV